MNNLLKRFGLYYLIVTLFAVLCIPISVNAAPQKPQLEIGEVCACSGEGITVPLEFDYHGPETITAVVTYVYYDESEVKFLGIKPGSILSEDWVISRMVVTDGVVAILMYSFAEVRTGLPNGVVANLMFASFDGSVGTSLDLQSTSFGSIEGYSIPGSGLDGYIRVTPCNEYFFPVILGGMP